VPYSIALQHVLAYTAHRDHDIAFLYVRHVVVLCPNERAYIQTFFSTWRLSF